jgi:hypothetical protein
LDAAQAESRWYELYKQYMAVHVGAYSKPIVQKELRTQTWTALLAEIKADEARNFAAELLQVGALSDNTETTHDST